MYIYTTHTHTASQRSTTRGFSPTTQVNSLHHDATHCNTLQHTHTASWRTCTTGLSPTTHCNSLQHAATHCSLLHHTHTATRRSIARELSPTTHCNTLQLTATHCTTHIQHPAEYFKGSEPYDTPQHAATHCNSLRHTHTASRRNIISGSIQPSSWCARA